MVKIVGVNYSTKSVLGKESQVLEFCFQDVYENSLKIDGKNLLLCFTIFEDNPDIETLAHVSNLNEERLSMALQELSNHSLIFNTLEDERTKYRILPLTKAFAYLNITSVDSQVVFR